VRPFKIKGFRLSALKSLVAVVLLGLTACTVPAQRRAQENATLQKDVSAEISRICALPPTQREAEVQKVKDQYGVVVFCGKP
jgi:outer membrane biogenesis lipoprotein LolB